MKKLLILLLLTPLFVFGQQVKFNQINPTLPANFTIHNNGKVLSADSVYYGTRSTYSSPSGNVVFIGTSITVGTGSSGGTKYSTQVATGLGFTEVNWGVSGSSVESQSPSNPAGGISFLANESNIPTYASLSGTRYLVVEVGPNDFNVGYTNYNPTNFTTDLTSLINYFTGTKGWPAANILILSNGWIKSTVYGTTGGGGNTLLQATYTAFQTASHTVATNLGTQWFDLYNWMGNRGADFLMFDNLHPNPTGCTIMAQGILSVLKPTITYPQAYPLNVNGIAQFSNIKNNNPYALADGASVLSQDASGNIGVASSLQNNIRFAGNYFLTGQVQNTNVVTATAGITPATRDWVLSNQTIYSVYSNGTNYTKLNLADGSVGFTYQTNYNNSNVNLATFINGAGNNALVLTQAGQLQPRTTVYFSTGNNGIIGNNGYVYPFTSSGNVSIGDTYYNSAQPTNGVINFLTPKGVNNSSTEVARFANSGSFLLGTTTDNNMVIDAVGSTARFQSGIGTGIIGNPTGLSTPTPLTTGGTLAAATYYYQIVAVDAFGNTTKSSGTEASCTTTGSTSSVPLTWIATTGATSYRIYQGTSAGAEAKYFTSTTNSATDIGSGYTAAALPSYNATIISGVSSLGAANFTAINNSALTASKVVFTDASKNLTSTGIGTSSQFIAGDGSLGTIGARAHTIFTPTTGGTVTLTNNQYNIINPAGTLVALTVTLPSSPANNDCVFIKYTQSITTVTYSGGTVVDGITAPTAGGLVVLTYDLGTTSWY